MEKPKPETCKTCGQPGEYHLFDVNHELRGVYCEACAAIEAERLRAQGWGPRLAKPAR